MMMDNLRSHNVHYLNFTSFSLLMIFKVRVYIFPYNHFLENVTIRMNLEHSVRYPNLKQIIFSSQIKQCVIIYQRVMKIRNKSKLVEFMYPFQLFISTTHDNCIFYRLWWPVSFSTEIHSRSANNLLSGNFSKLTYVLLFQNHKLFFMSNTTHEVETEEHERVSLIMVYWIII